MSQTSLNLVLRKQDSAILDRQQYRQERLYQEQFYLV